METFHQVDACVRGAAERTFRRGGTLADLGVVHQMFDSEDYSPRRLRRGAALDAWYESVVEDGRRPMIFDGGASIGASVVTSATYFPGRISSRCLRPRR